MFDQVVSVFCVLVLTPELRSPVPLRCMAGKGSPNSVVEDGCTLTNIFVDWRSGAPGCEGKQALLGDKLQMRGRADCLGRHLVS